MENGIVMRTNEGSPHGGARGQLINGWIVSYSIFKFFYGFY